MMDMTAALRPMMAPALRRIPSEVSPALRKKKGGGREGGEKGSPTKLTTNQLCPASANLQKTARAEAPTARVLDSRSA